MNIKASDVIVKDATSKVTKAEVKATQASYSAQKRANIAKYRKSNKSIKLAEEAQEKADATKVAANNAKVKSYIEKSTVIPISASAKKTSERVRKSNENEKEQE